MPAAVMVRSVPVAASRLVGFFFFFLSLYGAAGIRCRALVQHSDSWDEPQRGGVAQGISGGAVGGWVIIYDWVYCWRKLF